LLGGAPHSPEALMAELLRSVVGQVSAERGEQPAALCLSHPANWGPYKTDLLRQVVRFAGVERPVRYTSEPEAAAAFYAHEQRIEPGAMVAVYDLGGGTFDAAVLRKTATGFQIIGQPEGIERLGGIDFDAAVFNHVRQVLDGKLEALDEDDPAAIASIARLRQECVEAKEALSADTDVTIPVLLPAESTEVRLTRAELEAMVRPSLYGTIEALRRALASAEVAPDQLHSILLVGGGSRMPLVSQLVGAELNRPVAVDAHPKHAVALGAARLAADALGPAGAAAVGFSPSPAAGPPTAPVSPAGYPTAPVSPAVPTSPAAPVSPFSPAAPGVPPAAAAPPAAAPPAGPVSPASPPAPPGAVPPGAAPPGAAPPGAAPPGAVSPRPVSPAAPRPPVGAPPPAAAPTVSFPAAVTSGRAAVPPRPPTPDEPPPAYDQPPRRRWPLLAAT